MEHSITSMSSYISKKEPWTQEDQKRGWKRKNEINWILIPEELKWISSSPHHYLLLWSGLGPVMTSLLSSSPSACPAAASLATTGFISPFAIASPWPTNNNLLPWSSPTAAPPCWSKQQEEEQLTLWNCSSNSSRDASKTTGTMSLSSFLVYSIILCLSGSL